MIKKISLVSGNWRCFVACHEGYSSGDFIAVFSGTDDVEKDVLGLWELQE